MQEALFQQEKLAALGTLLANVAHELNNPLAVATMQLDNLQEEGGADAWTEDLETLRQAIERCQSVVQSFLALARQQPPTRHAVALNAVIGDVLVLLEHALEVDGITVELPPGRRPAAALGGRHQLHHVVANLITNAHHALRETAPPRHLRLTTAARCRPQPGDPGGGGQRAGHPGGAATPRLRALLYHQTAGRGQRLGVAAVPQHCGGPWGHHPAGQSARTRHDGFASPCRWPLLRSRLPEAAPEPEAPDAAQARGDPAHR